jgi:dTMP kinase
VANGLFITFEGGEGVGKSTQIALLAERLREAGKSVVVTREPGGTPRAEDLRAVLVRGDTESWSPEAEALLVYAARDSHLREVIRPALAQGCIVLCDRFHDSTRVYQCYAGGCSEALVDCLQSEIVGADVPDLTVILDLAPSQGLLRVDGRDSDGEDRFERKDKAFHETVRQGFLKIAEREPERCMVLDAAQKPDEIAKSIYTAVAQHLTG